MINKDVVVCCLANAETPCSGINHMYSKIYNEKIVSMIVWQRCYLQWCAWNVIHWECDWMKERKSKRGRISLFFIYEGRFMCAQYARVAAAVVESTMCKKNRGNKLEYYNFELSYTGTASSSLLQQKCWID